MQSIVLDTNVLVMSISARNVYHKVWQAFLQGDYTLCVSNEILEEYVEVLTRNINARVAEAVVYAIYPSFSCPYVLYGILTASFAPYDYYRLKVLGKQW